MSADPALRRATYADLEAAPPHLVAEIIDGRLETHRHGAPWLGAALFRLSSILQGPFGRRRTGEGEWDFLPRIEFHFSGNVLVPDLAGWRENRPVSDPDAPFVTIPPDWVCEILSPETVRLDRGAKRRLYAEASVGHLWLLDPKARVLEAFALVAGQWLLQATFEPGEEVRVAPFDAIGFPLDALFPFDDPGSSEKSSTEA